LPYSQDAIDELVSLIHERSEFYRASALPDTVFAVFIDAYHIMRAENNQVKEISIYTALGIGMDGFKSVLGFWVAEGSESRAFWACIIIVGPESWRVTAMYKGVRQTKSERKTKYHAHPL
jgi:transposase-like protein